MFIRKIFFIGTLMISTMCFASEEYLKNENMHIEQLWELYQSYWKEHEPKSTEPTTGDSTEDIQKIENFLGLTLPNDYKKSLAITYHRSKKQDGLMHSWFGSKTGIELFSVKEVLRELPQVIKHEDIYYNDPKYVLYFGNVNPVASSTWPKEWVPFLTKYGFYLFFDLREGTHKGEVLLYDNNGFNSRIAYVSKSYTEFMQMAFDEIKEHGELQDEFFLKKLHLSKGAWE